MVVTSDDTSQGLNRKHVLFIYVSNFYFKKVVLGLPAKIVTCSYVTKHILSGLYLRSDRPVKEWTSKFSGLSKVLILKQVKSGHTPVLILLVGYFFLQFCHNRSENFSLQEIIQIIEVLLLSNYFNCHVILLFAEIFKAKSNRKKEFTAIGTEWQ